MTHTEAYGELIEAGKNMSYLGSAMGLLHWDQTTYMPPKGIEYRVSLLAHFAGQMHRMATDPKIGELLGRVEGSPLTDNPLSIEAVNIRQWRRYYDKSTKIPQRLAIELARASAEGQAVWEQTRPKNNWAAFEPYLTKIIDLKREEADALGYEKEPYDALLDHYEPGETAAGIEPILRGLLAPLRELLSKIKESGKKTNPALATKTFPKSDQEFFAVKTAKRLGYDMKAGRLDVSAHPFTIGLGPEDVRITTRYNEHHFNDGFFGVMHEAGHAMYHQGLPTDHWVEPFCSPVSLGINESQSRMWENMVARSLPFWAHFYPIARKRFEALSDIPIEDFYFSINEVTPSLIRVEADEVTYNLHILLRFELELALLRKDLSVRDLPSAWNEKMEEFLGVTPTDFKDGVMQDVHWSGGSVGYFPTYTLGNLYAAQFFNQARKDIGNLDGQFTNGEFEPLLNWLRRNIHSQGKRHKARDLIKTVTGQELNPQYLVDYLWSKFGPIYDIKKA
jgi:carboxypeptidase Taq